MKSQLDVYLNEKEVFDKELESLSKGYLVKKGRFYYQVVDKKQTGITRDPEVIYDLCRKKYLLNRKEQLEKNISTISRCINKLDMTTPSEMIQSFSQAYKDVPKEYYYHPSIKDWLVEPYQKNPFPIEGRNHFTKSGLQVRSKSEILIGNKLEVNDIPYRYEAAVTFGNKTKFPDFIAKNPYTGKEVVWEHFSGLNKGYEETMNEKMNFYTSNGFIPFDTFIYTFEYEVGDPKRLQELIEKIILGI